MRSLASMLLVAATYATVFASIAESQEPYTGNAKPAFRTPSNTDDPSQYRIVVKRYVQTFPQNGGPPQLTVESVDANEPVRDKIEIYGQTHNAQTISVSFPELEWYNPPRVCSYRCQWFKKRFGPDEEVTEEYEMHLSQNP